MDKDKLTKGMEELKRLSDQIRLKIHLAGMDVRDAFEKLEPKVHELEKKASDATAAASREVVSAMDKVKKSLEQVLEKIEPRRKP